MLEFSFGGSKYYIDEERWEYESLYFKYKERLLLLVGFNPSIDILKEAKEYLFNKYPEYKQFKEKNG